MTLASIFFLGYLWLSDGVSLMLIATTRELLRTRPVTLTLRKIAKELDISESWLTKFANGRFDRPSPKRIEKLHSYLLKA